MKNLSIESTRACWWFTLFLFAALLLPRLATKGIFPDGLLYSSMARNLANGKGDIWYPVFSSGYWLPYVSTDGYFENLPAMIWVESLFFRWLGEAWWVEKLFSLLVAAVNAGLIFLIWRQVFRDGEFAYLKKFGWLPLLLWTIIPPVIWGNANNLMDNFQLIFCLAAVFTALKLCQIGSTIWLAATSVLVFAAVLAKGPVGFFPAAVPFLFHFIFQKKGLGQGFSRSLWVGLGAVTLLVGLAVLWPAAGNFFERYWNQRLSLVLTGDRPDAESLSWQRLGILQLLIFETLPLWISTLILWFLGRKNEHPARPLVENWGKFFLLLGWFASLPIAASARQNAIYILPAMPFFALAAACFVLPIAQSGFFDQPFFKLNSIFRWLGIAGVLCVLVFSKMEFGSLGRERELQTDLPTLQKMLPRGEKIAACPTTMADFGAHTYLQRFHQLELSSDWSSSRFVLVRKDNFGAAATELERFGLKFPVFSGVYFLLFDKGN